jgi:hypothetical protein
VDRAATATESATANAGLTPDQAAATRYDADTDMVVTDTAEVGEMNAAGRSLESDAQFEVEGPRQSGRARAYTTTINSGTGGEVPGSTGGTGSS